MTEPLQKQDLLLKMLKMTTSDNDGTALVAIRKANALLEQFGWDWDKLIAGKIKVVENPFAKVADPRKPAEVPSARAHQPRATQPPPRPTMPIHDPGLGRKWNYDSVTNSWKSMRDPFYVPPQPAQSAPQPKPSAFKGLALTKSNMYANSCWCCGDYVASQTGFIMQPTDFNKSAKVSNRSGWAVCCKACESTRAPDAYGVPARAAPRQTGQTTVTGPTPSLNNL